VSLCALLLVYLFVFFFNRHPFSLIVLADDDIFREFAGKRKGPAMESVDVKKAKARQTRDALTAEAHLRLIASASGSDSKRITHNGETGVGFVVCLFVFLFVVWLHSRAQTLCRRSSHHHGSAGAEAPQ
jgi:hypothetical protein